MTVCLQIFQIKVPTGDIKAARLPPKQPQNTWKRASLDSKVMVCTLTLEKTFSKISCYIVLKNSMIYMHLFSTLHIANITILLYLMA